MHHHKIIGRWHFSNSTWYFHTKPDRRKTRGPSPPNCRLRKWIASHDPQWANQGESHTYIYRSTRESDKTRGHYVPWFTYAISQVGDYIRSCIHADGRNAGEAESENPTGIPNGVAPICNNSSGSTKQKRESFANRQQTGASSQPTNGGTTCDQTTLTKQNCRDRLRDVKWVMTNQGTVDSRWIRTSTVRASKMLDTAAAVHTSWNGSLNGNIRIMKPRARL